MKKTIAIALLIAVCCVSVFALETKLKGSVGVKIEIGNKGITNFDVNASVGLGFNASENLSAYIEISPDFSDAFSVKVSQAYVDFKPENSSDISFRLGLQKDSLGFNMFGLKFDYTLNDEVKLDSMLGFDPSVLDDNMFSLSSFGAYARLIFKPDDSKIKGDFGLCYSNDADSNKLFAFGGFDYMPVDNFTFTATGAIGRDFAFVTLNPKYHAEKCAPEAFLGVKFNLNDGVSALISDAYLAVRKIGITDGWTAEVISGYINYEESLDAKGEMIVDKGWLTVVSSEYKMYENLTFTQDIAFGIDSMKQVQWKSSLNTGFKF